MSYGVTPRMVILNPYGPSSLFAQQLFNPICTGSLFVNDQTFEN